MRIYTAMEIAAGRKLDRSYLRLEDVERRERLMLKLLEEALREIDLELWAAGQDEVRQHPILRGKRRFVDRARRQIARWVEVR